MSKYEIPFLTAAVHAFGERFAMTRQVIEFYDVEHLQSMDETIDDLIVYCQKNGGTLA